MSVLHEFTREKILEKLTALKKARILLHTGVPTASLDALIPKSYNGPALD